MILLKDSPWETSLRTVLMKQIARITFCGGTGSVTGANFLLEADGQKILVDCGLTQGLKVADDINWDPFPYD